MERRRFIKSLAGVFGSLYLTKNISAHSTAASFRKACSGMQDDEKFWKLLRKQFLFPEDYAYFNTGGLGSSPYMVTNTVKTMMDKEDTYPSAGHSEKDFWEIKQKCAEVLGTGCKKEELALTSTATEGINIIINGLPLSGGDEIIISTHEHVALEVPVLKRMQNDGIVIKTFEPDLEKGLGNVDRISNLITDRTRLVFISHVTCTTGQIFPVKEIGELTKTKGIWFALDGAQAVAQFPFDLKEIGVDFYAYSGHKWLLGPKRTGILYVRESLLDTLKPGTVGAYSDKTHDMKSRSLEMHPTAQRYEYATQNDALIYGLGEAADFITTIGLDKIGNHNKRLAEMFYQGLNDISQVDILSPRESSFRSSMITFRFKNRNNSQCSSALTQNRFRVRTVGEANLDGIRVSFHVYNNETEVHNLLNEIRKLA